MFLHYSEYWHLNFDFVETILQQRLLKLHVYFRITKTTSGCSNYFIGNERKSDDIVIEEESQRLDESTRSRILTQETAVSCFQPTVHVGFFKA